MSHYDVQLESEVDGKFRGRLAGGYRAGCPHCVCDSRYATSNSVDLCASCRIGHRGCHAGRQVAGQEYRRVSYLRERRHTPQRGIRGELFMDFIESHTAFTRSHRPNVVNAGRVWGARRTNPRDPHS